MPEFLTQTLGFNFFPIVIKLVRIGWLLFFAYLVLRIIDSALKRMRLLIPSGDPIAVSRAGQRAETLRHIIRSVVKFALIVFVGLTISSELGFNIGPLLASVGIVGVAIGFGAQSLVKDVISGFFILLEDQYSVGDVIRVGTNSGEVERMTLRATVLRNLEGQVHIIPNGTIQTVTVLTREWARAVVDVTVSYRADLEKVFRALNTVGEGLKKDLSESVTDKPTILGVEQLGADGVTIRCIAKTLPTKQSDVTREWRKRIRDEFERQGIDLMIQRTVLVERELPKSD